MKIIACSDIHIDNRNPKYRIGNYEEDIFEKLQWLVKYATKKNIPIITISGDIFNKTGVPFSTINHMCQIFRGFKGQVITTFGQHDIRYHNTDFFDTPYGIMCSAGIFTHVSQKPFCTSKVNIYGAGWKERPTIKKSNKTNILLVHELVFKAKQDYLNDAAYSLGSDLLKRYKNADIIISGDNHIPFILKKGSRKLINCGSLCRKSKSETDYEPKIYIINTKNNKISKVKIPIKKNVFNLEQIIIDEKKKKALEEAKPIIEGFTSSLKDACNTKPNFEKNISKMLERKDVSKKAKNLVEEIMCYCLLNMENKNDR